MPSLFYLEEWKAESAAGSLVKSGYRRVEHEPRSGEVRVLKAAGVRALEWKVNWEVWVWDILMLRRLRLVDVASLSELRDVEADHVADFDALRALSREFPDREAALEALAELEEEQQDASRAAADDAELAAPPAVLPPQVAVASIWGSPDAQEP